MPELTRINSPSTDRPFVGCAPDGYNVAMSQTSTVVRGASIIAVGTLVSRLLGYVREKMLLSTFGASIITGAYNSAFSVPDLLYYLLAGGALSAAFIPVFSDYLAKKQQDDANHTGSSIANLMLLALIVGVGLELLFAPAVVRVVAPGYAVGSPEFNLTVSLTRAMCGMVIFTAISGLLTGILNSYHHFMAPTVVWNTYNIGIILGIGVFSKMHCFGATPGHPSIYGVAAGVMLGAISMAVLQLPVVFKYGFRYSPIIDLAHAGVKRVLILFAPVMVGLSLIQLNLQMIPLMIASLVGPTAVTDVRAANRIVLLPLGIFAIAISTAAFPRLSQLVALGEMDTFRATISRSIRAILLLSIPSSMVMFVLAMPLTCLLFGGGKYGVADVLASACALAFFSWGLLALGSLQLINRAFYSLKDTVTPVIVGLLMVGANFGLSRLFVLGTTIKLPFFPALNLQKMGYVSVPLFTTLTYTLAVLALIEVLRRRVGGIGGRGILLMLLKVFAAAALMGAVMYFVADALAPMLHEGAQSARVSPIFGFPWPAPPLERAKDLEHLGYLHLPLKRLAFQVVASLAAGILTLVAALKLLRVEELSIVTDRLSRKFKKPAETEAA